MEKGANQEYLEDTTKDFLSEVFDMFADSLHAIEVFKDCHNLRRLYVTATDEAKAKGFDVGGSFRRPN